MALVSTFFQMFIVLGMYNFAAAAALAFADMYCCAFSNILTDLQRTIKEYVVNFKSQSPISNQFVENHG